MRLNSIRRRILIFLLPLLVVVWGAFSFIVYNLTEEELIETTDAQTFQLASAIAHLQGDLISSEWIDEHHEAGEYFVAIRNADGETVYKSDKNIKLPQSLKPGAQEVQVKGENWVIWLFPGDKKEQHYIVGVVVEEATELLEKTVLTVSIPLALVLLFSIAATVYIVRSGLRPLTTLSETLASQKPENLGKLSTENQPDELAPIIGSLNTLFDRIAAYLEREQRFIDDAAHELRTPLTVVKAQCQVIETDKLDDATKVRFANIIEGVDRATHLAAKLLEHARAGQEHLRETSSHNLLPILQEALAQQAHSAQAKHVELQLLQSVAVRARVDCEDLNTVLSNLLANAVRHTPAQGEVMISVVKNDSGITLSVEDSGPGIPAEFRE